MTHHSAPIRIFLVDDHPMIRHGLAAMIEGEDDFILVGDAASGDEALDRIPPLRPDVVLMDLVMPGTDGITTIERLHPGLPETRFVVLTSLLEPGEIRRAIKAGASGYLLKNATSQELITVLRETHAGRRVLAPEATDAIIAASQKPAPGADLTQRERELLALMSRGMSNQQIADALSIALPTVKFHITNILSKLHADNRTEAVLVALKHKLVVAA
ncbi:MAG: response regulator transcription factor [Ideonella sp.]|jgi:NarL family two-component system response regulator LiaR|nr:response regulator transcription factor [Ideonella sp.]MBL0151745.1 response regulator transcription factor [Ideonella sp.]